MSIWVHFKELYFGEYPEDVYLSRIPPTLPNDVEQNVNLEALADKFAFKSEEQSVVQKLNTLIDSQAHQELTGYNTEHLHKKGFKILASGYGKVWEHPDLDGWLIKASSSPDKLTWVNGDGGRCRYSQYNNLHRVLLADLMRQEIAKNHWDILIPEKRLYRSPYAQNSDTPHKKYYALSKKLNILSVEETLKRIGQQPASVQRKAAIQICDLIKRTGFTDANGSNITALKNPSSQSALSLAIIDTEPLGLMKETSDSDGSCNSFKCCVLTGLSKFAESFGAKFSTFSEEIRWAQEEMMPGGEDRVRQKRAAALKEARCWFIAKIIVSILCPLLPLALLCEATSRALYGDFARTKTFHDPYFLHGQPNFFFPPFIPPSPPPAIFF
jgi:hypothetical protein